MNKEKISRRNFLKSSAFSAAILGTAAAGCAPKSAKPASPASEGPTGKMTYRKDPKTGKDVSILGYGCMRWPMIKDENGKNIVDQETVNQLVDHAIANGVNYFDTAPVYLQGQSEKATGIALKRHPRESFFFSTKLSNFQPHMQTFEASKAMYENSFKQMDVDYIDFYLLHNMNGLDAFKKRFKDNGILDYLIKEREKGKIRHLGFSYHGQVEGLIDILKVHDEYVKENNKPLWDFVLIQLNWMDWNHARFGTHASLQYAELEKRNIPVQVMEPLLGGRLSKVPQYIAERLKEREPDSSVASWAFRFAGSHKGILTVLSGMTYLEHLQDNLKTYSPLKPLNEDEFAFLEETAEIMSKYPLINCNDCKYCMPCPYGLDIPAILLHYNKCVNEGNILKSSQDENYRKARRAYLVGYDRAVPKLRQADRCTNCGQCNEHCPQRINIPQELNKINDYLEALKRETL